MCVCVCVCVCLSVCLSVLLRQFSLVAETFQIRLAVSSEVPSFPHQAKMSTPRPGLLLGKLKGKHLGKALCLENPLDVSLSSSLGAFPSHHPKKIR